MIEKDLAEKRDRELIKIEELTEENNPQLLGEVEDRKRRFLNDIRPH